MEFITFEIAKKLKEKGFKEKCIAYYWEKINEHTPSFVVEDKISEDGICILDLISEHNKAEWSPFIDAPTISQVLKWLRKEKEIYLEIVIVVDGEYMCDIYKINSRPIECLGSTEYFKTYEQAAIAGIEYVLDNLI